MRMLSTAETADRGLDARGTYLLSEDDAVHDFRTCRCTSRLKDKAREYMAANPQVLVDFKRTALELVDMGHTKIGSQTVWEVLRWALMKRTRPEEYDDFAYSNSHLAYVARRAMWEEPRLLDVFDLSRIKCSKCGYPGVPPQPAEA